ncbi:hypothetical protein UFOVP1614_24 [uncultured Caudovirales phage]|uniref:Uncharacterized protein n=1 Tax=uncultured Caudovirales phage TaxID=2100421 RepID=A0A6J5R0A8_9CAUD|nr:hypothetical protein UFOVP508_53 [uncultured Caudovirales phage]CAB4177905.1 hypothetical protein UFOVP1012_4 [uncultured Caudovirales phage]CAB4188076.1 hypothetical protein UFOVP1164_55 [uncultured Caudovirales phage]CAB4219367.1 hypothetical protein UFOVP1614_24 [uncultured Caudovirales phage]
MAYSTITPVKLGQTAITTGATTLYTAPASTRAMVKEIDVVNTTAASATFDVYLVPVSGTAGTGNAMFYQQPLNAKETLQWNGLQVMNAGETIQVKASVTGMTITASGAETV